MDTELRRSGIYAIRHTDTERMYVGSAVILAKRWGQHQRLLRSGKHHSAKLQHAWTKYGSGAFEFSVLEYVDDVSTLLEREQLWLDHTKAATVGYNISATAGSLLGHKHTAETKRKMSEAKLGLERSAEHRANLSRVNSGKKLSAETRLKISIAHTGKKRGPHSEEHRAKLSAAHKGKLVTDEARANMSRAASRRRASPETRAKMSAAIRKTVHADGYVNPAIGRKLKPEWIAKREATRKLNRELRTA